MTKVLFTAFFLHILHYIPGALTLLLSWLCTMFMFRCKLERSRSGC